MSTSHPPSGSPPSSPPPPHPVAPPPPVHTSSPSHSHPTPPSHPLVSTTSRPSDRSASNALTRILSSNPRRSRSEDAESPLSEEDPERPRPARAPSPTPPEDNAPPPGEEVTALRLTAHYAGLGLASVLGTLIRLGLDALATYDGQVIYALAWSQGVGCGIMGLALAWKNDIVAIYPPLYTFITTGIAGSVTTFSSWMLEGFSAFANLEQYDRNGLHNTVDGLAYSFSTFAIALACIRLGEHVSSLVPSVFCHLPLRVPPRPSPSHPSAPSSLELKSLPPRNPRPFRLPTTPARTPLLDILTLLTLPLVYLLLLLLYFLVPPLHPSWRHSVLFPLLLAPPGAILRFWLARLNPRPPFLDRFPLGTFLANMSATLVLAGVYVAQRRGPGTGVRCDALYGIQQGFCGCLSTVSTFAVEARAVRGKRWKWTYVAGSVVLGHLLMLAVVGGAKWDRGLGEVCGG